LTASENAKDYDPDCCRKSVADARQESRPTLPRRSDSPPDRQGWGSAAVIHYKLEKLEQHLHSSSRTLMICAVYGGSLFDERAEKGIGRQEWSGRCLNYARIFSANSFRILPASPRITKHAVAAASFR